jgi:hypothetical protein
MSQKQITRVRTICLALPESSEKLSHGEPTFFVKKKVFCMFANDHHGDGHVAVWVPAPEGMQAALIEAAPKTFFRPPYVGVKGWVGIELARVKDGELRGHILEAWRLIAPKRLVAEFEGPATD